MTKFLHVCVFVLFVFILSCSGDESPEDPVDDGITESSSSYLVTTFGSVPRSEALSISATGELFTPDFQDNKIYKVGRDGMVTRFVESGLEGPLGGAFDDAGNFYISNYWSGTVMKFDTEGNGEIYATGLRGPAGLLFTPDGDLLVANNIGNNISRITPEGDVSTFARSSLFNGPDALVYTDTGDLFAINFFDSKIMRIGAEGTVSLFAEPGGRETGYILFQNDHFIVPSVSLKIIHQIDLAGNVETIAGTGRGGTQNGAGDEATFVKPNGIVASLSGDTIFIGDGSKIRMITSVN